MSFCALKYTTVKAPNKHMDRKRENFDDMMDLGLELGWDCVALEGMTVTQVDETGKDDQKYGSHNSRLECGSLLSVPGLV